MPKKLNLLFVSAITAIFLVGCGPKESNSEMAAMPETLSYNFDIRPILSDKCFACHGPDANKREADLRLDTEEGAYAALKEQAGRFAIITGSPETSEVMHRIRSTDPTDKMPPPESNLVLTDTEIGLIERWIAQGAKYEKHWAFMRIEKPQVPKSQYGYNAIDKFIVQKLQSQNLEPSPPASALELIKRLSLDITGLPPSESLLDQYAAMQFPEGYTKLVGELLKSPAFGEKLGVLWLDISRYSDSYGYQDDEYRTQWPYRDWVIHALNDNMPFNTFLEWQLAGDLLPNPSKEQILATAFNRNHKYTEEGGVIDEEYRIEYVLDKTNTFSKGILGMTLECAQCHDHKYDPVSQKEYYQMFAFFNNSREKGFEGDVSQSQPAKTPILHIEPKEVEDLLTFINIQDTTQLRISVMGELDPEEQRTTYILDRGVYDASTVPVTAATPNSILDFPETYPKNRLGLAQWTTSRDNPLTARVFVNLIWQEIFGRGIVKSAGDFGMQGDLPTHPGLLNWLAADFMENGWDIKGLIKNIVMSETYRQSSVVRDSDWEQDPENLYLARAPRLRLTAENVQDLVLSSSGLLVDEIGGPSVKGYHPTGLWEAATSGRGSLATYVQDHGGKLYRRGIYNFIKLTVSPPKAIIFDGSNRDRCEVTRNRTNTPLQALVMLNDPMVLEAARVLAITLLRENNSSDTAIEKAFKRIVCREATNTEKTYLRNYYQSELEYFNTYEDRSEMLLNVGEFPLEDNDITAENAAMMQVIVSLYNLEETLTKV